MSSLSNVIQGAKNSVKSSFNTSLGQLAQGNIGGALDGLLRAPEDAINGIGARGAAAPGNSFAGMQNRQDALQNWCWYCLLPSISNANAPSISGFSPLNGVLSPSVSLPWYYVQTSNLPQRVVTADSVNMNGHPVHFPESYSVPNLTLGLFMDSSNKAHQWLKAWQGQILGDADPTSAMNQGMWGLPAQYKKTINIVLLDVKKKQMLNVRYINCWPSDPSALDLVSGAAEALVQNVTFMVEDIEVTVSNDKGFIDNLLDTAKGYAMGALSGATSAALNNLGQRALNLL